MYDLEAIRLSVHFLVFSGVTLPAGHTVESYALMIYQRLEARHVRH